jgi:DNA-binding response OmpR family regulator
VELTEQQMAFFKLLLAADRPLSADDILDTLYPVGERPGKQIVAVVICNLRKKLKAACGGRDPIETVRKVGFILHQEMLPSAVDEQQTPSKADWRRPRKEVAELVH